MGAHRFSHNAWLRGSCLLLASPENPASWLSISRLCKTTVPVSVGEERQLLGKCFECISLLARAVGRSGFRADAEQIMQAFSGIDSFYIKLEEQKHSGVAEVYAKCMSTPQ